MSIIVIQITNDFKLFLFFNINARAVIIIRELLLNKINEIFANDFI